MNRSNEEAYAKFARYYDLYTGDFADDLPLYTSFCKAGVNVQEIGCGTGRVLQALLENGATVTGVDICEDMLDAARTKTAGYVGTERLGKDTDIHGGTRPG